MRVWPDSYQERNALIPHLHEHVNLGDTWQSLPCTFGMTCLSMHAYDNECKSQSTLLSESWNGNMGART